MFPSKLKHTVKPTSKPKHTVKPTSKPKHTVKPTSKPKHTVKPTSKPKHTVKPTMLNRTKDNTHITEMSGTSITVIHHGMSLTVLYQIQFNDRKK
jgi:hypothetical protein